MPVYEYSALNKKGKSVSGIIDAESSVAARHKLRSTQIYPVSIKETTETSAHKSASFVAIWFSNLGASFTRVRQSEVALVTRQLATLVGAGFPLVTALDTIIPYVKSQGFKRILAQVKDSIVEGNSFAAALQPFPGVFSSLYVNMVRAGESAGTLEIVLERLAEITEKQQALNSRIKSAMAYPILMAAVGVAVLFFLIAYIVPSIASIFEDMGKNLPLITQILITSSDLLKKHGWAILAAIVVLIIGIRLYRKTPKGRYQWDKTMLRLPMVGLLIKKLAVARFARTLGSLLANGVTMLTAMEIVKNIVGNVILADAVEKAAEDVGKGQGLGASLSETDVFPGLSIQMIQVGEQSGELEAMLDKIADVFENEVESTILGLTSLLEPIMILVMAVVVGFIVLSICLPIFEMNTLMM